jgi:excisionase family DNA binding protein
MDSLESLISDVSIDLATSGLHAARWTAQVVQLCVPIDGSQPTPSPRISPGAAGIRWAGIERNERVERIDGRGERTGGSPVKDVHGAPATAHWLSAGEASAILGVSTATLRRWAAEGRLASMTTQGGHRRFAQSSVEALLPRPAGMATAITTGATAAQISRAYRQSLRTDGAPPAFLDGVPTGAREPLRTHGRVITTSILRYLEAGNDRDRDAALAEGLIAAAAYGRIAGSLGATMRETVVTFLRFRMPFVREMASTARRQGLDAGGATDLLEAVTVAIDRLLDATLEGFELAMTPRAGRTRGARTGVEEAGR